MSAIAERVKAFTRRPAIAHLLRANERFNGRLGVQFTAAAAYFSVLALVPILTLAFSIVGFLLTVVYPDLRDDVEAFVTAQLGRGSTAGQVNAVINSALDNWAAAGVVGLLTAAYSGAGWLGNLKDAVQAQMRANFDLQAPKRNIVIKTLVNLATLLGLLVMIAITFGLAALSTSATTGLLDLVGLGGVTWLVYVLRIAPIAVSVGAGWVLFRYLFATLPERGTEPGPRRRGALLGAVGLLILQYATGLLFKAFSGNAAVALFGPVIVLLLFFNLFARLILFVAAWIATADQPAFSTTGPPVRAADITGAARAELAAAARTESTANPGPAAARPTPDPARPTPDPARSSAVRPELSAAPRAGRATGSAASAAVPTPRPRRSGVDVSYLAGAATGIGLGALLAYAAQAVSRRRSGSR